MKGCRSVIYLAVFFTLLTTETAIASDKKQSAIHLERVIGLVHNCDVVPQKISLFSTGTKDNDEIQQDTAEKKFVPNPTQASFWWAAEQFDPFDGNLVQNWLAQPQKRQINLVVNWQLWTLLDYLGRYRFVNQFGSVARKYGYSLNIFNQKEQCLATYKYNAITNPPKWELYLEKLGQDSLQVKPSVNFKNLVEEEGV